MGKIKEIVFVGNKDRLWWHTKCRLVELSRLFYAGADPEGGAPGARPPPPLKLEKIWFFCVKSWFFTRNTPQIFAPPSAIGKNTIFLRKIVIFHTKYPKNFSASLRSAHFILSAPPLTWNPGSARATYTETTTRHWEN